MFHDIISSSVAAVVKVDAPLRPHDGVNAGKLLVSTRFRREIVEATTGHPPLPPPPLLAVGSVVSASRLAHSR